MRFYLKNPASLVDYEIDWSLPAGRTIVASDWTVEPAEPGGLAVDAAELAGARAVARIAGGRVGHVYSLSNRATFADGQTEVRTITLRVENG